VSSTIRATQRVVDPDDQVAAAVLGADPTADIASDGALTRATVAGARLDAVATALSGISDLRFADLFGSADPLTLRLVYALDREARYLVVEAEVGEDRLLDLSDSTPAAFVEESELFEQFGLRPAGGRSLDRLVVPPHVEDFPRLAGTGVLPANVHAPHAVGGHAFEFPVGPVRGAAVESLYYGLVTPGEEVVDVYLFTWHKHRGIERRLPGRSPREAMFHVERAEGLSAVANSWAFASAVENATGTTVPGRQAIWRAVYLELERLYNHAACLAALAQSTGLSVGQAQAEIALEQLLRLNAAVGGHRYLFGVIDVGGVHHAPDIDTLRSGLPAAAGDLRRVIDALLATNSFVDRLEATGQLAEEQATMLGLVGPIARSCGLAIDTRTGAARLPFSEISFRPALQTAGDALARLHVLRAEVEESVRLLHRLTEGGDDVQPSTPVPGAGLGWAESPRGESLAWVQLDDDGGLRRVRLRPASVRNWRAFDDAVRSGNVFTDVPIIEASFWLTVAGRAL
jgi:Ni,Fe-hydrogenase III large subunit